MTEEQKEKNKQYSAVYYQEHKESFRKSQKAFLKTEKGRLYRNRMKKRERENLTDCYIKQQITNKMAKLGIKVPQGSITPEQIEMQRKIITLFRIAKSYKS